jgi:hypothetical protein
VPYATAAIREKSVKKSFACEGDRMAKLSLRCKDKRFSKGDWLLALDQEAGALTDPDGVTRASFPHAEAAARLVLPNFWESVKDIGVRADSGDVVWFVPDRENVARIQSYLHGALAAQGPAAISALRTRGWLLALAGVGITVVAVVVMVASMSRALGNQGGGEYYVTIGATIFGLIVLSRGVAALTKASRADRNLGES